jgi:ESCRT-II complex subunit VPS25
LNSSLVQLRTDQARLRNPQSINLTSLPLSLNNTLIQKMSTNSPTRPSFSSTAPTLTPSIQPSSYTSKPTPSSIFHFPREHSFPPFFTRQPTLQTHHAQLQKWSSLILAYCRYNRLFKLSLIDSIDSPLFYNQRINKRLGISDVKEVVEFMRKEGRTEWIGGNGGDCWVWWRTPEEWAGGIYEWVSLTIFDVKGKGRLIRGID